PIGDDSATHFQPAGLAGGTRSIRAGTASASITSLVARNGVSAGAGSVPTSAPIILPSSQMWNGSDAAIDPGTIERRDDDAHRNRPLFRYSSCLRLLITYLPVITGRCVSDLIGQDMNDAQEKETKAIGQIQILPCEVCPRLVQFRNHGTNTPL